MKQGLTTIEQDEKMKTKRSFLKTVQRLHFLKKKKKNQDPKIRFFVLRRREEGETTKNKFVVIVPLFLFLCLFQ